MTSNEAIFRVGVSGHRYLDDPQKVKISIKKVLHKIRSLSQETKMLVYSPLSAGADQLVAECALEEKNINLIVLLPMPIEKYLESFSIEQKEIFNSLYEKRNDVIQLPGNAEKEEAYLQAGQYLLEHCDFLIAIWNGKKEQGKGGTGQVVQIAKNAEMPIAWIRANNAIPGREVPLRGNMEQGSIEYLFWSH